MQHVISSPLEIETFSTPPSTPSAFLPVPNHQPMLSRKPSRPSSIHIDDSKDGSLHVEVDHTASPDPSIPSPHQAHVLNSLAPALQSARVVGNGTVASAIPSHMSPRRSQPAAPKSPCFVHSLLDKGASLTDWLRDTSGVKSGEPPFPPQHRSSSSSHTSPSPSNSSSNSLGFIPGSPTEYDEEEDGAASLTRQLAATAVGVREMSKQLGRARVKSNIQNVMIITKARDNRLIKLTRDLAVYLMGKQGQNGRGLIVYVDHQLRTSKRFDASGIERDHPDFFRPIPRRFSSTSSFSSQTSDASESTTNGNGSKSSRDEGQLRYWTSDMCSKSPHLFDFVVTLGGDGTVLFTSWLFQKIVPPVLPFALGSLGFLTNFDFADHQKVMDSVIESGIRVNLRMRFTCTVYRSVKPEEQNGKKRRAVKKGDTGEIMMKNIEEGGWEALEGNPNTPHPKCKDKEIMCFTTRPVESFEVLNDLVVDRGPSPYVSLLELFGDEHHMTTVQADGLTISTPTGSTAYSLSAGGSLVHPEIPAILITPICPHTLSFRPMLLPDSMELRVCVPYNSRSTAWASFDGRGRVELKQGDHIKITASKFPFPTVCADNQSVDWFHAISRTLKWNERERQKSFVVVEEDQPAKKKKSRSRKLDATPNAANRVKQEEAPAYEDDGELGKDDEEDEDDEDEEEEEEKFDIDDSSPEAANMTGSSTAKPATGGSTPQANGSSVDIISSSSSEETHPTSLAQRAANILVGGRVAAAHSSSGIESPNRFAGAMPHPPKVHSRHLVDDTAHRSHLHSPHHHHHPQQSSSPLQHTGSPNQASRADISLRTPDTAAMKTPRPHDTTPSQQHPQSRHLGSGLLEHAKKALHLHRRGRSVGEPATRRTAFAVYGQDESDSNASE